MKYFLTAVLVWTSGLFMAQLTDDFSDGNFTTNPSWNGTNADFIVNTGGELQINNTIAATSYLSISHGLPSLSDLEWHLKVRQTFSPSSSNFGRIYLTSSSADLTSNPDGYYIQLGEAGSTDAVRLFKSQGGLSSPICAGTNGQIASSFNIGIRITRDATGLWQLYIDPNGGTSYGMPVSGTDASALLGTHFGVLGTYTVSNSTKFYFDDIYVGPIIYDTIPPVLLSAVTTSSTAFDILFNEPLETASAELTANYALSPLLTIQSLALDAVNPSLVHGVLSPSTPFVNGSFYTLSTNSVADIAGNISAAQFANLTFLVAENALPGDVIINEFMADPSPSVGQPEFEYVEIYNRSSKYIDLNGWKITDGSSNGTIGSDWLYPGGYKVLCTSAATTLFAQTVSVSAFPSINNAGDSLILKDNNGVVIDQLYFTDLWYNDDIKAAGGYSLERINPLDPCSAEDNWAASISGNGGTPGVQNSVFNNTPDTDPPLISELIAFAPSGLEVQFSEGLDSLILINSAITVTPSLSIASKTAVGAFPNSLLLQFNEQIQSGLVYQIEFSSLTDCWGNSSDLSGLFVLPDTPAKGDVVLNEILYDPYTGGYDWVELFNKSEKLIDLQNWSLANFDNDTIDNQKVVSDHFFLKPGMYAVLGKDSVFVKQNYPFSVPGTFVYSETPAFNNDSSTVYLIWDGQVMDKVSYTDEWQFKLLDETDGISLERIDPEGVSDKSSNWHSAAEAVGFATPGGENSQYRPVITNGTFSFTSSTISPDNDGFEDFLHISYEMSQAGLLGTCHIYDDRGRLIRNLFKNELLGTTGAFVWDGVTDNNVKASIGAYVLDFEAFSTDGSLIYTERKAFVLAGKL